MTGFMNLVANVALTGHQNLSESIAERVWDDLATVQAQGDCTGVWYKCNASRFNVIPTRLHERWPNWGSNQMQRMGSFARRHFGDECFKRVAASNADAGQLKRRVQ